MSGRRSIKHTNGTEAGRTTGNQRLSRPQRLVHSTWSWTVFWAGSRTAAGPGELDSVFTTLMLCVHTQSQLMDRVHLMFNMKVQPTSRSPRKNKERRQRNLSCVLKSSLSLSSRLRESIYTLKTPTSDGLHANTVSLAATVKISTKTHLFRSVCDLGSPGNSFLTVSRF